MVAEVGGGRHSVASRMATQTLEVTLVPPTECSCAALLVTHGRRRLVVDCGDGLQRVASDLDDTLDRLSKDDRLAVLRIIDSLAGTT